MRKLTTEQFIEKARSIHGEKYEYYLVEYMGSHIKVNIICDHHGIFEQTPNNHLCGHGCYNKSCIQNKVKHTNIDRFGVENPFQSKDIQTKGKQTCLEKYGVEYPTQNKRIQEKCRQALLKGYGVEYPMQNKEIQEKYKKTNIERHGVEYPSQKHYSEETISKLSSFEWLYNEYIEKNKTSYQIAEDIKVNVQTILSYLRIYNIPIFKVIAFSKSAIQWLNDIMEKEGVYIQHAGNIGEYKIPGTRYSADGYCKDNNTIYEFYGDCFHGNLEVYKEEDYPDPFRPNITTIELYNRTIERENRIRDLGYNMETIWEKEVYL